MVLHLSLSIEHLFLKDFGYVENQEKHLKTPRPPKERLMIFLAQNPSLSFLTMDHCCLHIGHECQEMSKYDNAPIEFPKVKLKTFQLADLPICLIRCYRRSQYYSLHRL